MSTKPSSKRETLERIFSPFQRKQTYKNLLYLVIAFPLGIAYFTFLTVGLVFGIVLLVIGIGFLVLLVTIGGVRIVSAFERWLANTLLDVDIEGADERLTQEGTIAMIRGAFEATSTWRGLGFLLMKFWVGIVGFLLAFAVYRGIELLTAPLFRPVEFELVTVNDEPIVWQVESVPEVAIAVLIGVFLLIALVHIINATAYVAGRMAIGLLGVESTLNASAEAGEDRERV